MSVMDPHIRVLRALGKQMARQADASRHAGANDQHGWHDALIQNGALLGGLGKAMLDAADALEAEEPQLREETPVNYDPKGKR